MFWQIWWVIVFLTLTRRIRVLIALLFLFSCQLHQSLLNREILWVSWNFVIISNFKDTRFHSEWVARLLLPIFCRIHSDSLPYAWSEANADACRCFHCFGVLNGEWVARGRFRHHFVCLIHFSLCNLVSRGARPHDSPLCVPIVFFIMFQICWVQRWGFWGPFQLNFPRFLQIWWSLIFVCTRLGFAFSLWNLFSAPASCTNLASNLKSVGFS